MLKTFKNFVRPLYRAIRKPPPQRKLKKLLSQQSPLRVVVGAENIYDPGWIPTEISTLNLLKLADWKIYFKPGSIDALFAEHVWEYLSIEDARLAAQHCYFFLKPGAYLR